MADRIRLGAIVQVRMGSTRLPGKTMMKLAGRPVLGHVLDRILAADVADELVVATTVRTEDDVIESYCLDRGLQVIRGSVADVLDRFLSALNAISVDAVIRITGDDPCKDPKIIREVCEVFSKYWPRYSYVNNWISGTFPDGLDVEVISASALRTAAEEAKEPSDREHVTPYIWKQPERFPVREVTCPAPGAGKLRVTVDDERDLRVLRELFSDLGPGPPFFGLEEIVRFFERRPDLLERDRPSRNESYWKQVNQES